MLLDSLTPTAPDHVCAEVARESVRRNGGRLLSGWARPERLEVWPLGTGAPSPTGQGWDALLLPGRLPIGLIVTRDLERGVVTLIGHVLPSDYEPAQGGRIAGDDPLPSSLLGRRLWTFVQPSDLTTRFQPATAHELHEVERTRSDLLRWYRQTLLGRTPVGLVGRPPGTGFADDPQFPTALRLAVQAVRAKRGRVTQAYVAEELGTDERGLRRALSSRGLEWREVVRTP